MTIIQAIKTVLNQNPEGLGVDDIYDRIIQQNLYSFGAKNPKGVVNGEIRRHCFGLDFPTASPVKHFYIVRIDKKKPIYNVIEKYTQANESVEKKLKTIESDELPEEKVEKVISAYNNKVKEALINKIMGQDPSFFEQLVVDLLLRMGYGYDKNAGTVVGGSHDGGIDGIISEDKLGLDLIYIQAKRYGKGNPVGREKLQAFVGAMNGVNKGVFLTTSFFSKEAREYADALQNKHIRLIDGEQLCEYMLKYEVGVHSIRNYKLFKIDEDFFLTNK